MICLAMHMVVKISYVSIWATILFWLVLLPLPYWSLPANWLLGGRLAFLLGSWLFLWLHQRRAPLFLVWLSLWIGWLVLVSMFHQGQLSYVFSTLVRPYLVVLFLWIVPPPSLRKVLSAWRFWLALLLVIDAFSMLLYPHGMVTASYYRESWFLGYKTARMVEALPLLTLSVYLDEKKYGRITKVTYLLYVLILFTIGYAKATAGMVGMLFLGIWIFFYRSFLPVYPRFSYCLLFFVLLFLTLTLAMDQPLVQYLVQHIFHKTPDLSYRAGIWANCFALFARFPLSGVGVLTTDAYVELTHYALGTSAHSLLLTQLVSGGVIGLGLWLIVHFWVWPKKRAEFDRSRLVWLGAVLAGWIIGLTSSTLAFAPFTYLWLGLLEKEKSK